MNYRKVLIVDDEKDTCFLLWTILNQQQYDASFVHSLSDARETLANNPPHVIFLDNHLGDGSGVDFIPTIINKYPGVKIIMITAFDTLPDRKKAFSKGAHFFLGKPFEKKKISEALEAVFEEEKRSADSPL